MARVMTRIQGCPDRSEIRAGQAYFSNTGPLGAECGECVFFAPKPIDRLKRNICAKFRELTGEIGAPIQPGYRACKYFERKP